MSKIAALDLYCDKATKDGAEAWLKDNGVTEYSVLYYGTEDVHPKENVLAPLRTWNFVEGPFTVTSFPFVIFIENRSDIPDPRRWPQHFIAGPDFSALKSWLA